MSCDCLSKYHGRASRDALRVWSGWGSTVMLGPRYEPDYGPRYEPDYGPRYEQDYGPCYAQAGLRCLISEFVNGQSGDQQSQPMARD